jgi:hypothetical protein
LYSPFGCRQVVNEVPDNLGAPTVPRLIRRNQVTPNFNQNKQNDTMSKNEFLQHQVSHKQDTKVPESVKLSSGYYNVGTEAKFQSVGTSGRSPVGQVTRHLRRRRTCPNRQQGQSSKRSIPVAGHPPAAELRRNQDPPQHQSGNPYRRGGGGHRTVTLLYRCRRGLFLDFVDILALAQGDQDVGLSDSVVPSGAKIEVFIRATLDGNQLDIVFFS